MLDILHLGEDGLGTIYIDLHVPKRTKEKLSILFGIKKYSRYNRKCFITLWIYILNNSFLRYEGGTHWIKWKEESEKE